MIIKNSIALGTAAAAGVVGPALIFGAICTFPPFFGIHGAAAFTTSLGLLGGLISLPTLFRWLTQSSNTGCNTLFDGLSIYANPAFLATSIGGRV